MKRIFFDLETTGMYWNFDAPIQIAAVLDEDGVIIDSFNEKIRTTNKIAPQASQVHGIYERDLIDCRSEKMVLSDFIIWILNSQCDEMIGYNSKAFDLPMLATRSEKFGLNNIFDGFIIKHRDGYYDCVKPAKDRNLFQLKDKLGRKWNLKAVSECLDISAENAHDALADVVMLQQIWYKISKSPSVNLI